MGRAMEGRSLPLTKNSQQTAGVPTADCLNRGGGAPHGTVPRIVPTITGNHPKSANISQNKTTVTFYASAYRRLRLQSTALENRCTRKSTVGSNPTSSAICLLGSVGS